MTTPPRPLDELLAQTEAAVAAADTARYDLLDEIRVHPALRPPRPDGAAGPSRRRAGSADGGAAPASELDPRDALRASRLLVEHGEPADLALAGDLAWRAHQGGQAEAGPLFATCADRISLYQGRPAALRDRGARPPGRGGAGADRPPDDR